MILKSIYSFNIIVNTQYVFNNKKIRIRIFFNFFKHFTLSKKKVVGGFLYIIVLNGYFHFLFVNYLFLFVQFVVE